MGIDKKLSNILASAGFDLWDVFSEKTTATSITFEDSRIDKISSGIDSGIGLRGIKDGKTFYGYTNDAARAEDAARTISGGAGAGNREFSCSLFSPGTKHEIKILPEAIGLNSKIELLKKADHHARSFDPRIKQVSATYSEKAQEIEIVNDMGHCVKEVRVYTTFIILIIAASGSGRIETAHNVISGYAGYEILTEGAVLKKVSDTAALVLKLLEAEKKIAGEMAAVLSSEAGGTMIHEAVGHSLEADLVQKDMSIYKGKKGEKVAADIVTVVDDATLSNKRGAFLFDDEGTPSQRKILVDKGILKNFLYDRESAKKDGVGSTGNGRRESYKFRPIPRMTNTMIAPGAGKADSLIKDTKKGIFVKKMGGGQVNTVTGEFIFEVKDGYLIEDGKITFPLRDATLMGTGSQVLNTIDAVCDDLGFDVGTCGKDGQGVPVSDAQPTLRIPKILVGSK
jgi:TldD protein